MASQATVAVARNPVSFDFFLDTQPEARISARTQAKKETMLTAVRSPARRPPEPRSLSSSSNSSSSSSSPTRASAYAAQEAGERCPVKSLRHEEPTSFITSPWRRIYVTERDLDVLQWSHCPPRVLNGSR